MHASLPFTVLKRLMLYELLYLLLHQMVVHASLPFTVLKLNIFEMRQESETFIESRACLLTVYGFETLP